jgi:hypothetical protein
MPPIVPAHRPLHFPTDPRETESTSNSTQFRSGTGSSTIVYIHTPEGESDAQFTRQHTLDRTQAISENNTSLRRMYNLRNVS